MHKSHINAKYGFTIVELLVVIVVIGILAAITIVAYSGITQRAKEAQLKSDLKSASTQLEIYSTTQNDGNYPNDASVINNNQGITHSKDITLSYQYTDRLKSYCVEATYNDGTVYHLSSSEQNPVSGRCPILSWSFANAWGGSSTEWGRSIIQMNDGSYMMAGHTSSFGLGGDDYVAHYSSDGELLWSKTWGGTGGEELQSIVKTSDGGFLITGSTSSYAYNLSDAFIAKFASDYTLSWSKTWGGNNSGYGSEYANSAIQTSDGGYAVCGYTGMTGGYNNDAFILKYDATGTLLWSKNYGGTGDDSCAEIAQLNDGSLVIVGHSTSTNSAYAAKYDITGNLLWTKTWGNSTANWFQSVASTTDGGFVTTGYTGYGSGSYDIAVVKYDSDGNLEWDKAWGKTNYDFGGTIKQTTDGGYIIEGNSNSVGAGGYDMVFVKYSSTGSLEWDATWGGVNDDYPSDIIQTTDGGYVVAGTTYNYGVASREAVILKYKPTFQMTGCLSPLCQDPVAVSMDITAATGTFSAHSFDPPIYLSSPVATSSIFSATPTVIIAKN